MWHGCPGHKLGISEVIYLHFIVADARGHILNQFLGPALVPACTLGSRGSNMNSAGFISSWMGLFAWSAIGRVASSRVLIS
jgi:hypothetical protein